MKLSSSRYSLGEGVEAGGVDAAAHVDVDGCGVAGGGGHHGDPLPRLALDVRHAGHPHERHSHGVTSTSTTSVTIYCEQLWNISIQLSKYPSWKASNRNMTTNRKKCMALTFTPLVRCFTMGTDERDELCIENMRCIRVRIWDVTGNQIPGRLPAAGRVSAAGCSGRSAGGSAAPGTAASSASTQSVWYVRRTRIKYTRHLLQRALTGIL